MHCSLFVNIVIKSFIIQSDFNVNLNEKPEQSNALVFSFLKKLKISPFCEKPFFFLFKNKDLEAAFFMSKGSPFYVNFIILKYNKIGEQ